MIGERRWPPPGGTPQEARNLNTVLEKGPWTLGPWTENVEALLCNLTGAPHAVAFNSCTSALHAGLVALGCGRGTSLIAPAFTFAGSLTGAGHLSATITFADIDGMTLTLPAQAGEGLVLAVDLHGVPHTGPRTVTDRHWDVLTDSCQALGTRYNGRHLGHAGTHAWSFSSSKLITAPDGGAVTTDDDRVADALRELRDYGLPAGTTERANAPVVRRLGHNWRPSELSMAMVAARWPTLQYWADRAREAADRVHQSLDSIGAWRQHEPPGAETAWHKIRFGPRDLDPDTANRAGWELISEGIPVHHWGTVPLHQHPAYRPPGQRPLTVTEKIAAGTICLGTETCPPWTWTPDETERACHLIETILGD